VLILTGKSAAVIPPAELETAKKGMLVFALGPAAGTDPRVEATKPRLGCALFLAHGAPAAPDQETALAKLKRFAAITHAGAVRCVLRSLSRFALGQNWTRSVSRGPGHLIPPHNLASALPASRIRTMASAENISPTW
jgi:hypothetical protein